MIKELFILGFMILGGISLNEPPKKVENVIDNVEKNNKSSYILVPTLEKKTGEVRVNWTFSDSNINDYYFKVYRREDQNEFIEIASNVTSLSYLDTDVPDREKPCVPELKNINYKEVDSTFEFEFNETVDNGTTYSYYVEAYTKDGTKVATSEVIVTDMAFGLKGHSYIINSNETDNPDNEIDSFDNNKIIVPATTSGDYIHIKAIDNQNNISDTLSIKAYDDEEPILNLSLEDSYPTNSVVRILIEGEDNVEFKRIEMPDGEIVEGNSGTFEVVENGVYEFKGYDVMGNSVVSSINISNIDKDAPSVEFEELYEDGLYKIKITAIDSSGISHIILPNGERVDSDAYVIDAELNTQYEFTVFDKAGNSTTKVFQIEGLEPEKKSSNLDIYIQTQNTLSLSLETNYVYFDNFNPTENFKKENALEIVVSSTLPYEVNAFLETEIKGSNGENIADVSILNIKESNTDEYKQFLGVGDKINLISSANAEDNRHYSFDFMLLGGKAYKTDVYKASIKLEINQI